MWHNLLRMRKTRLSKTAILEYVGWWLAAILFLGACTPMGAPAEEALSEDHLPTVIAMTVQAGQTPTRASSSTPTVPQPKTATRTSAPPTRTPTATDEPTATETRGPTGTQTRQPSRTPTLTPTPQLPIGMIQILSPGPASMVVSPVTASLYMIPGERGTVIVELLGEDGRILVRKVLSYTPGNRVRIATDLEFEIPVVAEAGRLVISTEDDDGRISALASVDLIMLSVGKDEINPSGDQLETIIIQEPIANTLIQGGSLMVSGLALAGDEPLYIELIKADGSPAGPSRQVEVIPLPDYQGYGTFTTEIPYTVTRTTAVRLIIYERAGRIPGITHLSSTVIFLTP